MREYFRLVRLLKQYKGNLILSFILTILFSVSNAISVYLSIPLLRTLFLDQGKTGETIPAGNISNLFDSIRYKFESFIFAGGDKYASLAKVCILMLLFYFLKNLFGYTQSIIVQYVEKTLITNIRRRLYHKFNSLSLRYYSERKAGDIISRFTNDVNNIQNTVSVTFTNLIKDPMLIIVFLGMAFYISWKLTLISILIIPISTLFIIQIGRKLKKYSIRVQEKLGEFTSVLSETIYGSKIIRAFSMEEFENRRFEKKLKSYFRSLMKNAVYSNLTGPLTEFISIAIGVFIIWYGGREIFAGQSLAPEEFLGYLIIVFQIMTPIKDVSTVNNRIQESAAASKRIFEILDAASDIIEADNAVEKNSFDDSIEFKNVWFRYDEPGAGIASEEKNILRNVNFKISKNEKIAIVGLSGVGKSTLIDLLPRFYDVTSGEILVDGKSIKDYKLSSLRKLFGIVTQEIILFNDTIKNNIAYGDENTPMEKIIEAAINANAHDFILETENGYDTIIGERGIKLSGGQRQRIAIARALLKNAPVMIFDEATSSLDSESEALIQEAIDKLIQSKTSIIIAHRLSTIRNTDRILVIDEGEIKNVGTHDDLMQDENSIYRKLYEMQFS